MDFSAFLSPAPVAMALLLCVGDWARLPWTTSRDDQFLGETQLVRLFTTRLKVGTRPFCGGANFEVEVSRGDGKKRVSGSRNSLGTVGPAQLLEGCPSNMEESSQITMGPESQPCMKICPDDVDQKIEQSVRR